MKKLLKIIAGLVLVMPFLASAQVTVPSGGTGTTTFPTNWFLVGSSALRLTATGTPFFSNFSFLKATGTQATTTSFFSTTASTTNLFGTNINGFGLVSCTGGSNALQWSAGIFSCGAISGGSGSAFPFTPQSWGVSTTTTVGFFNGLLSTGSTTISGVNISPFLNGSWIDLPTTGPSGIGSGGAGVNTWIAYVFNSNQYLSDSITGDIAYRGALGKRLIFGIDNGGGNAPSTMQITANGINVVGGATSTQATSTNAFATTQTVTNFYGAGLTSCANASNALTWSGGQFGCNTISGSGGGGTDVNWSFFNNSGIKLGTTTNQVLVSSTGHTATTSLAKLEVGSETAAKGSLLVDASTTLQNFTGSNSTTTNATTTSLAISAVKSALHLADSNGVVTAYGGASACSSNNFVTTISSVGGTTCGTASISGINLGSNLADLTATNGTLTFSGTYNGSTARNIGLNLGSANTWTAGQMILASSTIGNSTQANGLTIDGGATTTGSMYIAGNLGIGTKSPTAALDVASAASNASIVLEGNSSTVSDVLTIRDNNTTNNLLSSQVNPSGATNVSLGTVPLSGTFQTGVGATGGLIFFNKAAAPIIFGTGGNAFTNEVFRVASNGLVGIGTTTPQWALQIASSTGAQLTLSDPSSLASNHWSFRNAGGNLYIATSSPTTFATSSATSALSIISNGNVGIGSTTPFRKFSVQDGALQALTFGADNGSVSALTQYGNGFAEYREESGPVDFRFGATSFNGSQLGYVETVGATEIDIMPNQIARMDFTGDGYIGVGTTTPKWQFQIASSTAPQLTLTDNTNVNHWSFRNAGGNFYLATSSPTTFATSTVSAFSINANGIPTFPALGGATGCAQFSSTGVLSNTGSACGSGGGSAYPFGLTGNATSTKTQFNGGLTAFASSTIGDSTQANGLTVSGGATTTLTQYVGTTLTVGSTTPYATVSINAAAQTNPYLAIGSTTSKVLEVNPQSYPTIAAGTTTPTALFAFNATTTSTVSGLDTFIIASSTSSTNDQTFLRLTRTGSMFAPNTLTQSGAATDYWCYDANGQFIRVSNTCTVSALKFKQDIHPLTLDALSIVNQMQPVTYNLKQPMSADENREQIGFIADWSATLLPDFILHDSNGDIHGFNYEQYTAVLTKAIQQLSAEAGKAKRSAEENWQDGLIGLLILGFIYQQVQIRKLKK